MKTDNKGFIQITFIIVGTLVVLKYAYNIDVIEFLTTGKFRAILDKIYNFGLNGWEKYQDIILEIWNYSKIFIKNLWSKI
jgi:hypothetical protein